MKTKIHFSETDSIEVKETFGEVVKKLEGGGWVQLGEQGSTVINAATVRYVKDASKPADPLVAWGPAR
jgi:hypothetical protein